ncbi:hypothetical protein PR202_ga06625 [Eleusine coracana subsp. coracana]|uniref:Reverse transcriptase zinc-binding domain-containing protein n=1 Tax=Eleusine coracana subsp. coracana TaxID=191504 RepID=A0AAV5BXS1_ELECO|nr:hypothetical protein PR202_ga06625 [Eleusine coracana subsp. coracana]
MAPGEFHSNNWRQSCAEQCPPEYEGSGQSSRRCPTNNGSRDITGPLSVLAIVQYILLWERLQDVSTTRGVADQICWRWTFSQMYSAKSAYNMFFCGSTRLPGADLLWKTWTPPRVKLFMYTVMHQRTWTVERRKRHGLQDNDTCILCNQSPEHIEHLLLHCPIAKKIWWETLSAVGLSSRFVNDTLGTFDTWTAMRTGLPKQAKKAMDSLFMLVAWHLWKERNSRTFNGKAASVAEISDRIMDEARAWVAAGAKNLGSVMSRE